MRRLGVLGVLGVFIGVATLGLLTALVVAHADDPAAVKGPPYDPFVGRAFQARQDNNGYTGSQSCQSCHQAAYDTWRKTLHVQMTKPTAEARVEGDFSAAAAFSQNGRAYTMERR